MIGSARTAISALVVVAAIVAIVLLTQADNRYVVSLRLANAGGLRNGSDVRVGGVGVGTVTELGLGRHDVVTAELRLDPQAVPIGRGASATIQPDQLFGERFVELNRGDRRHPEPSGSVIPLSRTSESVRLDDVVDAIDPPTRTALQIFLDEQGAALVGRGQDLAQVLTQLPLTLSSARQVVAEFAQYNQTLGQLVDQSDRVVTAIDTQRPALGRLLHSAGATMQTLASRDQQLGDTVRRAPAALAAAQSALLALQGAAAPLIPAAEGLRATAPPLTATLLRLPSFTRAALPTLAEVRTVSPRLEQLGERGTPVVRALEPLTATLVRYDAVANPAFSVIEGVTPNLLGVMEGWARSTQPQDAASHIFRFGVSLSSDTFAGLTTTGASSAQRHAAAGPRSAAASAPVTRPSTTTPTSAPPAKNSGPLGLPLPKLPNLPVVGKVVSGTTQLLSGVQRLRSGGGSPVQGGTAGNAQGPGSLQPLLHYLLGR